jgi:dATP pyrophosphohydrolase
MCSSRELGGNSRRRNLPHCVHKFKNGSHNPVPAIVSNIVEVYLFRRVGDEPQFLLLKRSSQDVLYPDIWQIVTGTLDAGERAIDGAKRELQEETGLAIKTLWTLPDVNSFFDPANDTIRLCPMFAGEVVPGMDPHLSKEHQMFGWFDYDRARSFLVWPSQQTGLDLVNSFIVSNPAGAELTRIGQKS